LVQRGAGRRLVSKEVVDGTVELVAEFVGRRRRERAAGEERGGEDDALG